MYKETTDNTPIFRYIQRMADGVTSVLVRTVFGAVLGIEKIFNCHSQFKSIKKLQSILKQTVKIIPDDLGMFYFGFNTGVVNAPEASIKDFTNNSYLQHYGSSLDQTEVDTLFTVITSAFIGERLL